MLNQTHGALTDGAQRFVFDTQLQKKKKKKNKSRDQTTAGV